MRAIAMVGVALVALLTSANPAAAQTPDRDALCFQSLGEVVVALQERPELATGNKLTENNLLQQAFGFYSARLVTRFTAEQRTDVLYMASKSRSEMSYDDRKAQFVDCFTAVSSEMRALATSTQAAADKFKQDTK